MNRLNRIKKLDPEQRIAVVEAGVVNLQISQAAERIRTVLRSRPVQPADLHDGRQCRVQFRRRALCLKYGMTSNHILGLKVVLADGGEVVRIRQRERRRRRRRPDWSVCLSVARARSASPWRSRCG